MNILGHFITITRHRHTVMRYCFRVGLIKQGLLHDLSKYSPTEFLVGIKYYQGDRSPNNAEREDKGVSMSWLHHKGRNKHHLEYWIDYDIKGKGAMTGMKMPVNYVVEMLMDRIAACKVYEGDAYSDDSPYRYYLRGAPKLMIHPESKALLEELLIMLRDEGEQKTFDYVKNVVLPNYRREKKNKRK